MRNPNLVLVVDDDPGMLKAVKRLLRQHDYEPITFSPYRLLKTTPASRMRFASSSTSTAGRFRHRVERGFKSRRRFRAGS
jgi:hypothetical protein